MIQAFFNDAGGRGECHGGGVPGQRPMGASRPKDSRPKENQPSEGEWIPDPIHTRNEPAQEHRADDAEEQVDWRNQDDLVFHIMPQAAHFQDGEGKCVDRAVMRPAAPRLVRGTIGEEKPNRPHLWRDE